MDTAPAYYGHLALVQPDGAFVIDAGNVLIGDCQSSRVPGETDQNNVTNAHSQPLRGFGGLEVSGGGQLAGIDEVPARPLHHPAEPDRLPG